MNNEHSRKIAAEINNAIHHTKEKFDLDTNLVSDTYHTFGELYEHRITLYIALCKMLSRTHGIEVWRSLKHSDGTQFEGWFTLGINRKRGEQITYHLPISKLIDCDFARTVSYEEGNVPKFDGHTPDDVLNRLRELTEDL